MNKPFAPACERNAQGILDQLSQLLAAECDILEIGSGTGQHATHFLKSQPGWNWQCSDQLHALAGIQLWLNELDRALPAPIQLDVSENDWPQQQFDAVFTANTLHIMPWAAVCRLFAKLPDVLRNGGSLTVYGPFKYGGSYTSASNAEFDIWLKQRDAVQGIRDFEKVDALAQTFGMQLTQDLAMPANNRLLHWVLSS